MNRMTLVAEGDRHVVVTRRFAAPPERIWRAHTEPDLIRQWMLGPDGWTMPVCECDPRPGGRMRYGWSDGQGNGFHLTGEFHVIEPFHRIVHVERMHLPPPGPDPTADNHVETTFAPDGNGTRMVMRMTLPDADTRAAMLATGMEDGMAASYDRLDALI